MLGNIWLALVVTFALAIAWLRLCDFFAGRGLISSSTSRKIIHIGTGPIYVLCWLFFPELTESRFIAMLVPLMITLQFFLVGLGLIKDQSAVKAMSRSGDRREILKGPLFYGIVFVLVTIIFWKTSPIGIISLMALCGGDGMADLIGKRFGKSSLPWSKKKTWMGSLAMLVGGTLFSWIVIILFTIAGVFSDALPELLGKALLMNFAATIVESLPYEDIDNVTVPAAVILSGFLVM